MATLSLFPEKIKGKPLTPSAEWRHYFDVEDMEQLAQQLNKYKEAGYIDFDTKIERVMYIGTNDAPNTHLVPTSFVITKIDKAKVADDLIEYLENWCGDELLTSAAYRPDDSARQHEKLNAALARAYKPKGIFHINAADVYGDNANYIPPFWETVLAPQLVSGQYRIRQMDYDKQPFVDIKITDTEFLRSLELAAKSSEQISDDDPQETKPYKGLQARRDGLIYYNDEEVPLSQQQRDVMRVLLKRPEESRAKETFTESDASIFSGEDYTNLDKTLAKLIAATHTRLRAVVGKKCIFNTPGQGWKLKL